jgi:hypothetical protein
LKNLIFSSVLILLFCGCTAGQYKGFQRTTENVPEIKNIASWFQGDSVHFLFHAGIDVYNNHFGGIMIIKKLVIDSYRVVYITELGIKIFDMEFFKNGEFKLHYCLDAINRKSVIKTLKSDIGIMLENIPAPDKLKFRRDSQNAKTLIRSKDRTGIRFYILNDKTNRIEEISLNNSFRKKMNLFYFSANGTELDSIRIKHHDIKLNIKLSNLKETKSDVP